MKNSFQLTLLVTTVISFGSRPEPGMAQISVASLPGASYSQNFDSLASAGSGNPWTDNSTISGWYAATNIASGPLATYRSSSGTDTSGAVYSLGTNGVNPASDRALGSIASGTSGTIAYGVRFVNDTTSALNSIMISCVGEQWRNAANTTPHILAFSYRVSETPITSADSGNTEAWVSVPALDFTTPVTSASTAALDGNASANRHVFSAVMVPGAAIPAGSEIFLRWKDVNDSGNDHAIAVDDLNVVFGAGSITTNAPTYASITPAARTNQAGTSASFTVSSDGSPAVSLSFQWRKDGSVLSDSGSISGATTPTLSVSNLLAADVGSYDVVVANTSGSVTSSIATLTVIDPAIISQSADQAKLGGESVNLTVTARGTPTLAYQWFFGSAPVESATSSTLALSNLQSTNQGTYTCRVTNGAGDSVTSAPINLTITVFPSVTLALWDFNDTNAPATAPPPSLGAGSAALLGGATATFASGVSSDHSATGTNAAWNTSGYPAQSTSSRTAGVQFNVSTLGYHNVYLAWNQRHSASASKYTRLQYTADGTTFSDLDLNAMSTDSTFVFLTRDLSGTAAVNNNPNFGFRLVTEFESAANPTYVPTATGSSYGSSGTIRLDLLRVYGDPMGATTPAPTTISNILGGLLTYGEGGGAQFVLLRSTSLASPLSSWSRLATNFTTPGTFTLTGGAGTGFYRIKSE